MRALLLTAALLAGAVSAQEFIWEELSAFPGTARDDASAFAIGTSIYVGTGREMSFGLTNDWYRFDTGPGNWVRIASVPANGRQYCTAFSIDGIGYLFGGSMDGGWSNELWAYDPSDDSWAQRASLPSTGRSGCVSFVIDGSGYIVNGRVSANALSNALWRYDPAADSWTEEEAMPGVACQLAASFTIGNSAYVVGGADEQGVSLSSGWRYEATTGAWNAIADLPDARFGAEGFARYGNGLIVGGANNNNLFPEACYWYLPWSDEWILAPDLAPGFRKGGSGTVVEGHVYYGTGVNLVERLRDWHRLDGPVGVVDRASEASLSLVPVPAVHHVRLHGVSLHHVKGATLLDARGRRLAVIGARELQQPISVDHLPGGAYFLLVDTGERMQAIRFLRMTE